jgi:epoxyqueuosine reductase QueG
MDRVALTVSTMIEEAGHLALPIPSYSPLRFYEGEPRGMFSLKHAAAEAGLGRLGRNTLLIHPKLGNVLRLGALLTEMEWPEVGTILNNELCPESCRACEMACPVHALKDGTINKTACLGKCIKHVFLPHAVMLPAMKWSVARSKILTRFMELFSLNFFEIYGIGCTTCLKACPHFPEKKLPK